VRKGRGGNVEFHHLILSNLTIGCANISQSELSIVDGKQKTNDEGTPVSVDSQLRPNVLDDGVTGETANMQRLLRLSTFMKTCC